MPTPRALLCALVALTAVASGAASAVAQDAVRYRDANGQWIYTDHSGARTNSPGESLNLPQHAEANPGIEVRREDDATFTRLVAVNRYLCPVTIRTRIEESTLPDVRAGVTYYKEVAAGATETLVQTHLRAEGQGVLRFHWSSDLGSASIQHHPERPYRAPFALGATFPISQAYPTAITHTSPDSRFAVDIVLPDGTPVYAARAGKIINLRHDAFIGALDRTLLDRANVVEILHDDGTIAVYAHLHWDSIRVHIGQQVVRGEYIADSGNTGFSSGPHLHFAVWRNSPTGELAVPVSFEGPGGVAVVPQTGGELTAY
ncbi:MAG: M23 family metallopeptidase [Proteobacteria bacterium]|nr:M23 family metallopeptidase [Pseudomonadota bacterium]